MTYSKIVKAIENKRIYFLCLALSPNQHLRVPTHFAWSHHIYSSRKYASLCICCCCQVKLLPIIPPMWHIESNDCWKLLKTSPSYIYHCRVSLTSSSIVLLVMGSRKLCSYSTASALCLDAVLDFLLCIDNCIAVLHVNLRYTALHLVAVESDWYISNAVALQWSMNRA